jgi:acetyl esterase/lipase
VTWNTSVFGHRSSDLITRWNLASGEIEDIHFIFSMKINLMSIRTLLLGLLLIGLFDSCAFRRIHRAKEITYLQATDSLPEKHLNVFSPRKGEAHPVMIFVHGGSWSSGHKEIYDFFGSRMARRKVVTVIIDYPLSPEYKVYSMEKAVVAAVNWTMGNIADYGGDPDQIFISGHSAGGHLAALVAMKSGLFEGGPPFRGAILNDPGALDMDRYLEENSETSGKKYLRTFTEDRNIWRDYTPQNYLGKMQVPLIIMEGGRTYPMITETVRNFRAAAEKQGIPLEYSYYPHKHHIPMMLQFFFTWTKGYRDVLGFIEKHSSQQ